MREWVFLMSDPLLHHLPPRIQKLEDLTRHQWARVMAGVLLNVFDEARLLVLLARGEDAFIAAAKPILAGHAFRQEDYQHIYRVLKDRAEQVLADQRALHVEK